MSALNLTHAQQTQLGMHHLFNVNVHFQVNTCIMESVHHVDQIHSTQQSNNNVYVTQVSSILEEYAQSVIVEQDTMVQIVSVNSDTMVHVINVINVMDHVQYVVDHRQINAKHVVMFL
mgnify:CR=1 FL=1